MTSYTLKSSNLTSIGHFSLMKALKTHQSMRWNASNYMSNDLLILLSISERGVFGCLFSWRVERLLLLFWVPLLLCNCTDLTQIKFKRILCNLSHTLCSSLIVFLGFYHVNVHWFLVDIQTLFESSSLCVLIHPIFSVDSVDFFYLVIFCLSLYSSKMLLLALLVERN